MKILLGFILLSAFLFISCDSPKPIQSGNISKQMPKIESKGSISGRETFVKNLKSASAKEGLSMELSGENKDVLNIKSTKISNYALLQDFKEMFEDLRNGGFRELNFTDSTGETRNVNLTVLDK